MRKIILGALVILVISSILIPQNYNNESMKEIELDIDKCKILMSREDIYVNNGNCCYKTEEINVCHDFKQTKQFVFGEQDE